MRGLGEQSSFLPTLVVHPVFYKNITQMKIVMLTIILKMMISHFQVDEACHIILVSLEQLL